MPFKKDALRWFLSLAIVLALYLVLILGIPFVKNAAYWLSFGFTLAAFGVAGAAGYVGVVRKEDAKSRFYGFPVAKIGLVYGVAQLALGLVVMALASWIPAWLAAVAYVLMLGAACLGLIAADTVVEQIHVQDAKLRADVRLMRSLQSKLNQLASQCDDPDAAAALKKLAEELRYSDPVSSAALKEIEADLSAAVEELQAAVIDADTAAVKHLCRKASALLAERSRLRKLNKT